MRRASAFRDPAFEIRSLEGGAHEVIAREELYADAVLVADIACSVGYEVVTVWSKKLGKNLYDSREIAKKGSNR